MMLVVSKYCLKRGGGGGYPTILKHGIIGVILDGKGLRGLGGLETHFSAMTTLATVDLKAIHEIYKELKKDYFQYGERFLYFLATCQYLDPDLDLDIAMKMRP